MIISFVVKMVVAAVFMLLIFGKREKAPEHGATAPRGRPLFARVSEALGEEIDRTFVSGSTVSALARARVHVKARTSRNRY